MTGVAGTTVNRSDAEPVPPAFVAETLIVNTPADVGVPEIKPVVASTFRPAGRSARRIARRSVAGDDLIRKGDADLSAGRRGAGDDRGGGHDGDTQRGGTGAARVRGAENHVGEVPAAVGMPVIETRGGVDAQARRQAARAETRKDC